MKGFLVNQELLLQLETLKTRDTAMREELLQEGRLYGKYEQTMQNIHKENAKALDKIISIHGWPGISKVGLKGSRTAWLIAQHAICTPDLQRKFFQCLSEASKIGDVPKRQVALLMDRIRFNEGRAQVYGTVLDWNEKGEFSCELEDPENIDTLRAEAGLPPFLQSQQKHLMEVEAEGGKMPEDFKAYKEAYFQWAKSVGWQ